MRNLSLLGLAFCLTTQNILANDPGNYPLALSLVQRASGKLFRENVVPHWLPGNQTFWYRVQTNTGSWEYVLVDATSGKITRAASATALNLPAIKPLATSGLEPTYIHPSRETGEATQIRFVNHLAVPVELFWIDTEGKHVNYGLVPAHGRHEQNTYAGHVWLVADGTGKALGVFEASAEDSENYRGWATSKNTFPGNIAGQTE